MSPPFHVDVAHFFASEKRVVFQHHVVCVPDDNPELIRFRLPGWYIQRRPGKRHVHGEHIHPHFQFSLDTHHTNRIFNIFKIKYWSSVLQNMFRRSEIINPFIIKNLIKFGRIAFGHFGVDIVLVTGKHSCRGKDARTTVLSGLVSIIFDHYECLCNRIIK